MKVRLERLNDEYLFQGTNGQGNSILLDNVRYPEAKGVSPMETLLMAAAACSGIDIVSILKKQRQSITAFYADIEGERYTVAEAQPFKKIIISFHLEGDIQKDKAKKATELSFEKYCSVTKTFTSTEILFEVWVNGEKV